MADPTNTPRPILAELPIGTTLHPADMYRVLGEACAAAGGQNAWAARHGLSRQYVSDVMNARRQPGEAILQALGLQRATRYVKMRTVNG
nr:hypothetical protein [uncultured Roseococcus sp.]